MTTEETELRHSFNVIDTHGQLPDQEVPNFRSSVEELSRDLKQLTSMLLTVCVVVSEKKS